MRRAFTLIEVLITTSIISVLIALVMGGVGGAMTSARSFKCSNNLRQMGVAAQAYASVYQDAFPAAVIYFQRGSSVRTVAWDFESDQSGATKPGSLTVFTDQPLSAMQCPDLAPEMISEVSSSAPLTGYHYNTSFIGHEGFYPEVGADGRMRDGWSRVRLGLNCAQRRRTDSVAMFADGGFRGSCNCCFLDGHIASIGQPCASDLSTKDLLKFVSDFPKNGFLSGDDSAYDPR